MSDSNDQQSQDQVLEQLAKEAEAQRAHGGKGEFDVDDQEQEEASETREDHGGDAGPLQGEADEVPMGSFKQVNQRGGHSL